MMHEFLTVYLLYRKAHPASYALKTAWRIAVQGEPF